MKIFVPVEEAIRRFRDGLFARLRSFDWFQTASLLALKDDIILVTKQFDDHILMFSPRETIGKDLFRKGHYQRDLANRVLDLVGVPKGKVLLELGANIGTHTVYLMRSGKFDRAVSVEPDPRNLKLLKHNLSLNELSNAVTVFECAAGDNEGSIDLYFGDHNFGASSVIKPNGSSRSVRVPLRRVDDILAEAKVSPGDIGLVWMDIEGAESEALKSMAELVRLQVPILMEYGPWRYGPERTDEIAEYLASHYRRCIVFGGKSEREMDIRNVLDQRDILLLP
ncbi:FkbM family methyltransferase [Mesorhizobium humile]|uniref:FkbM family methyltransferase n=1 Tax=Mesorhizobium humile TaxID=3072313 RepID=A0ABU4YE30_9HYPH|nr:MULTISPECIES: FkbM family methyltransferase [unclassified Mesorhizobium]MDX8460709.1 FkbM family methyltransferase [Mesorhizobium sp. VK2D]MDX8485202.1 FkbM family methyltransferase [Mesorhizobium sp. VK2B]